MDRSGKLTVLDQIAASEKVRKTFIDVASGLYAKKGFTATSIQEISEMAGVAFPVTYHYVKQKSEIMHMIMGRGRNAGYPAPPAQIPACGTTAPGSYLG